MRQMSKANNSSKGNKIINAGNKKVLRKAQKEKGKCQERKCSTNTTRAGGESTELKTKDAENVQGQQMNPRATTIYKTDKSCRTPSLGAQS